MPLDLNSKVKGCFPIFSVALPFSSETTRYLMIALPKAVLRQFCMEKGLTQDQLSEMVGVASPFISMLESGHKYPNIEKVFKLTDALAVRPGAMLDAVEERERHRGL